MSATPSENDKRKWALLGGLGLLALLGRRRRWRHMMMARMYGGGFGGHGPGRFGGYGPWAHGDAQPPATLPPFIEATLKAWHDRAHGTVPPASATPAEPGPTQV